MAQGAADEAAEEEQKALELAVKEPSEATGDVLADLLGID